MGEETRTEQEAFWAGEFGNEYLTRNTNELGIANRTALFARVLEYTQNPMSFLELGANRGYNILALQNLRPLAKFTAVEINESAFQHLKELPRTTSYLGSIFEHSPEKLGTHNLAFTCGVLIHIAPGRLSDAYRALYQSSNRYIFLKEYYSRKPVEVTYRGHKGKLFKRDFAGEMLDMFPDLSLVSYGFRYHRDINYNTDDDNWFLLEKTS